MAKNLTGLAASSQTHPEIRPGDIWQDGYGEYLTVGELAFNRVRFIRNGYAFPVTMPAERFTREFSFVSGGAANE